MEMVFLICAVIGTTVMLCQFAMTLMGMGDDGGDFDSGGDVDAGDFSADAGDLDHGGTSLSEASGAEFEQAHTSWLFGVLSLRTIVAAMAFFGLTGKACLSAEVGPAQSLVVASAAGFAAMVGVYKLMQLINRLKSDGNVHIQNALGLRGTVYIPIPGDKQGAGKVQINVQNRTMEYQAMTAFNEKLPTGMRVEVTRILGPETIEVAPLPENTDSSTDFAESNT